MRTTSRATGGSRFDAAGMPREKRRIVSGFTRRTASRHRGTNRASTTTRPRSWGVIFAFRSAKYSVGCARARITSRIEPQCESPSGRTVTPPSGVRPPTRESATTFPNSFRSPSAKRRMNKRRRRLQPERRRTTGTTLGWLAIIPSLWHRRPRPARPWTRGIVDRARSPAVPPEPGRAILGHRGSRAGASTIGGQSAR
jgi:hypothetical protein